MNLASPRTDGYYSREAFRRWYDAQPQGRYERVDGRIVAMAPERGAHLRVKGAIYRALDRAVTLAGVACQTLPTHHRRTDAGIDTRIVVNGPIMMATPGIVITVDDIYGAEHSIGVY